MFYFTKETITELLRLAMRGAQPYIFVVGNLHQLDIEHLRFLRDIRNEIFEHDLPIDILIEEDTCEYFTHERLNIYLKKKNKSDIITREEV